MLVAKPSFCKPQISIKNTTSVELLTINTNGGNDTLILEGNLDFAEGIMFDGGDGTDYMILKSDEDSPSFTLPIYPDDTQGYVYMDGCPVQFTGVEGGITLDADGKQAFASLSGTDAGDEIRFAGTGSGKATFARDGQVTVSLENFGAGSSIELLGQQGEDTISVSLNNVAEFAAIRIDGGGPRGADFLRFAGTSTADTFEYTPGATSTENGVVKIGSTSIQFFDAYNITFVGLEGVDSLKVNEPFDHSDDLILMDPCMGADGSFQFLSQGDTPESVMAYPTVSYLGIEQNEFSTGTGSDTLLISSESISNVSNAATIIGGNGTTTVTFDEMITTTFTHDIGDKDLLEMNINSVDDSFEVTPGIGCRY